MRSPDDWSPDNGDVWSSDGCWVQECARSGQRGSCAEPDALRKIQTASATEEGTFFFLGWLSKNYGNFLTESLSYLWPTIATDVDMTALRFAAFPMEHDLDPGQAPPFLVNALRQFGVELSEVYFIRRPVVFERLLLPTPSAHMYRGGYVTPMQVDVWMAMHGSHRPERETSGRAIYLSRRKYTLGEHRLRRPLANELEVETLFREYGYEIIFPETLDFEEQLRLYRQCASIAGPAGSNMHNSAFMPANTRVLILAPTSFVVAADHLINAVKGSRTHYYFTDAGDISYESQQSWSLDLQDLAICLSDYRS